MMNGCGKPSVTGRCPHKWHFCLHGIIIKLFILYVSLSTRIVRVGLMTCIPVLLVMVPPSCCLICRYRRTWRDVLSQGGHVDCLLNLCFCLSTFSILLPCKKVKLLISLSNASMLSVIIPASSITSTRLIPLSSLLQY